MSYQYRCVYRVKNKPGTHLKFITACNSFDAVINLCQFAGVTFRELHVLKYARVMNEQ